MEDLICPISKVVIKERIIGRHKVESRFLTDFDELKVIGAGGFGVVSLCKHKIDGQMYAVKKVPILIEYEKLKREVEVHASLSHPSIVRIYTAWVGESFDGLRFKVDEEDDFPSDKEADHPCLYIQLEYCPGSLKKLLEMGPLNEAEAGDVFTSLLDVVEFIHQKDIMHRDLSPANILMDEKKGIKLADFGLAKIVEDGNENTGSDGNVVYKAPEVKEKAKNVDIRADIYSLGIIFFELYQHMSEMERTRVINSLRQNCEVPEESSFPKRFIPTLQKMISRDPVNRFQNIAKIRSSLDDVSESEGGA